MNNELVLAINQKLSSIDNDLDLLEFSHPSIFVANGGVPIYFAHRYLNTKNDSFLDKTMYHLERCIDSMDTLQLNFSLCNGVTGLAWLVRYLEQRGILENADSVVGEIDMIISDSLKVDFEERNYDLLYGFIGKGIYFLEHEHLTKHAYSIVDFLIKTAITEKNGKTWLDNYTVLHKKDLSLKYNLGLAHGIPSILIFLVLAYEKGIKRAEVKSLLVSATEWLLAQKNTSKTNSIFPSYSELEDNTQLAWCYGDLGIIIALINVGVAIGQPSYIYEACNLSLVASKRRIETSRIQQDNSNNMIEPGFCHGLAGITHIFSKLSHRFRNTSLEEASNYWVSKLLNSDFTDTDGRLKYFRYEIDNGAGQWYHDRSLLSGSIGVGLTLMSLDKKSFSGWDKLFLTNI